MQLVWLVWLALASSVKVETGPLSYYSPQDGFNAGQLACGGELTWESSHIALRNWRKLGCGRKVLVCAARTRRCVVTKVRDAGPYGIIHGPRRHAVREGRWRVWTKRRPPEGWRWRAVADLSPGLWRKLGRPPSLSPLQVYLLPKKGAQL